jgi:glycosyltransferase involved in cell wall biosynthesis
LIAGDAPLEEWHAPSVPISLIITTYNWPEALDLVLRSVSRQREMPDEVLVADDGSGEATAILLASWSRRLPMPLHHLWQENKGYRLARSRNRAIAAARGEYVIMVDGDMVLDEHFVFDHARARERGRFVQGVRIPTNERGAKRMLQQRSIEVSPLMPGLRRRHKAVRAEWLSRHFSRRFVTMPRIKGCNQGYWRADLIAVNGFEERMVGWGPEDKECAARLLHVGVHGMELRFAALATHLHHASRAPSGVNPNDALLAATLSSGRKRCDIGVDQHLAEFARGIPDSARPPWRL